MIRGGVWRGRGVLGAGRRSAGLGSEGAVQEQSHAVGVRAFCACLRDWWAICKGGMHRGGEVRNLVSTT